MTINTPFRMRQETIPRLFLERYADRLLAAGKHNECGAIRDALCDYDAAVKREEESFAATIERKANEKRLEAQRQRAEREAAKTPKTHNLEDLA